MEALRLPSLEKLTISLGFGDTGDEMDDEAWSSALGQLSIDLMPTHFSESSRLTSLSYLLFLDRDTPLVKRDEVVPNEGWTFYIALDRIFDIQTSEISSWIRVRFIKHSPDLRKHDFRERCHVRELKVFGCDNMRGPDFSEVVSGFQRDFDVWKNIERVTIQGCKNLAYEDVVSIVGEEKLEYLD
ncbi:hypothetical protein SCHPADRAFT_711239 [Schizopora paradoxa]|uniref:F-box domain-containing protein n=1 Tax=Schizopora paradoxa TaxID=27342 RepID=A0A0H2RLU1_9AGAM|nr:hypothetical protein SCHPADRAFT_711239 [Schizopora paradoxa]